VVGVGGAAESQRAFAKCGRCSACGEAPTGDLFGGGMSESEDGGGEPACGQSAIEVARVLTSADDLFESRADRVVGILSDHKRVSIRRIEQ
jgi:hypothetical protein